MTQPSKLREVLYRQMSERDFQASVVELAKACGWLVYHTWSSKRSTPGFPDLVMVRAPRIVFAELKREGKNPTTAQTVWLESIEACDGAESYLWHPSDWNAVQAVLR